MATKVDNYLILPYHWIDSMCTDLAGNYNLVKTSGIFKHENNSFISTF